MKDILMNFGTFSTEMAELWAVVRIHAQEVFLGMPALGIPLESQRQTLARELRDLLDLLESSTAVRQKPSWWHMQAAPAIEGLQSLLVECDRIDWERLAQCKGYFEGEITTVDGFIQSLTAIQSETPATPISGTTEGALFKVSEILSKFRLNGALTSRTWILKEFKSLGIEPKKNSPKRFSQCDIERIGLRLKKAESNN